MFLLDTTNGITVHFLSYFAISVQKCHYFHLCYARDWTWGFIHVLYVLCHWATAQACDFAVSATDWYVLVLLPCNFTQLIWSETFLIMDNTSLFPFFMFSFFCWLSLISISAKIKKIFYMCLPAYMCTRCMQCSRMPQEGVIFSGTGTKPGYSARITSALLGEGYCGGGDGDSFTM